MWCLSLEGLEVSSVNVAHAVLIASCMFLPVSGAAANHHSVRTQKHKQRSLKSGPPFIAPISTPQVRSMRNEAVDTGMLRPKKLVGFKQASSDNWTSKLQGGSWVIAPKTRDGKFHFSRNGTVCYVRRQRHAR